MVPEEGRSAIAAARGRSISVSGDSTRSERKRRAHRRRDRRNIVPERCSFEAEARSHDERKLADLVAEMLEACTFAATLADCAVEAEVRETYRGYRFRPDEPAVQLA